MTKKDYELIAASIWRSQAASSITGSTLVKAAKRQAILLVALDLAASLSQGNERFDKQRFLNACGFN